VKERSGSNGVGKVPPEAVFSSYQLLPRTSDECFAADGKPHAFAADVLRLIDGVGRVDLKARQRMTAGAFLKGGITFTVYSDKKRGERIFPFDLVPRIVDGAAWDRVERGLVQRVAALNAFLLDIYGEQRVIKEGIVPESLLLKCPGYLPKLRGIVPPGKVHVHIAGIDLIRDATGELLVLEDNARTPSGVSYVLENRAMMKRFLPYVFQHAKVRSVDEYPARLREALRAVEPVTDDGGVMVVLTPGPFNSAYFEHSFLARRMGTPLVQASDLFVHDAKVYVKTTAGPQRVTVVYRRIDDDFLDPEFFRPDSLLGVPGIMKAYAAGNVAIANAPGNGVADDKAIYPYMPEVIRFFLSEEPILGQVETMLCGRPKELDHVLANLHEMVVKEVEGSGGYGMLVGPKATAKEREEFAAKLRAHPDNYIAQPLIELSTSPTLIDGQAVARRVDLRPFVVTGKDSWVLPGGLTRVALVEGSYVVNSSQGGGSKDTWVLQ
jgi:uncharacterized circularly permuted ATP-grasp superfamily protein